MAYRIDYSTHSCRKVDSPGKQRTTAMAAGFFLLFLLLVNLFWPAGTEIVRQALIPGDPEVTVTAVDNLVSGLKDGQQLSDAVTTFCREIIANAETAD